MCVLQQKCLREEKQAYCSSSSSTPRRLERTTILCVVYIKKSIVVLSIAAVVVASLENWFTAFVTIVDDSILDATLLEVRYNLTGNI